MALRCLLFSSDEGTATPILEALADLGLDAEHCSDPVATIDKATHQSFQVVIIDWDQQPEAGLLLMAARDRKAAERPLTLAIVSNDVSVPQALQAGANSILRKPILESQVRDTLTTARDLLRSKQESAAASAMAAAAGASPGSVPTIPNSVERGDDEKTLRAGEFLQSPSTAPGGQYVTDSDDSLEPFSVEPVDPLKDLEPMAASMTQQTAAASPTPPSAPPGEFRGLEWYLKTRAATLPPNPVAASAPPAPTVAKPELIGFEQTPSFSAKSSASTQPSAPSDDPSRTRAPETKSNERPPWEQKPEPKQEPKQAQKHEQKCEAELFAHIEGGTTDSEDAPRPRSRLKGAIVGAVLLAACAILSAPQAPWHPQVRAFWAHGQQTLHGWLNPQPVTPVQAPVAHEDFGRAGDEYKMPVTENIPDATTDPSQIHVLPVIDPTIKKTNSLGGNAEQPAQSDPTGATPTDQAPPSATPDTTQPVSGSPAGTTSAPPAPVPAPIATPLVPVAVPLHTDPPRATSPSGTVSYTPVQPAPKNPQPHAASTPGNVPSSLKSQMASTTPDAGGDKAPESAMPSIEPVVVPEATERALLTEQPPLDYPASGRGQQGTVVLQVLIGRDGTVKEAKFMQGSFAFARAAIDGVKLWKFKPYSMNGRPVSVQSMFTINFKP